MKFKYIINLFGMLTIIQHTTMPASTETTPTHYEILGISDTARPNEIKAAYKAKALQYHPDKNPTSKIESEEMFKKIQSAYETLLNPQTRHDYDRTLPTAFHAQESRSTRQQPDYYFTPEPANETEIDFFNAYQIQRDQPIIVTHKERDLIKNALKHVIQIVNANNQTISNLSRYDDARLYNYLQSLPSNFYLNFPKVIKYFLSEAIKSNPQAYSKLSCFKYFTENSFVKTPTDMQFVPLNQHTKRVLDTYRNMFTDITTDSQGTITAIEVGTL